jgi:serine/threonine-protein phosphatase 4 regulatory subunit 2
LGEEPSMKENQIFSEQFTINGGLKLPPFPPRRPDGRIVNEIPVVYMNEEQANELKEFIFTQLHQFEEYA